MIRRDLIAGLLLMPLVTPVLAAMRQISILHSGFPNRTPIHVLIEALRTLGYENGNMAVMELLGDEGDATRSWATFQETGSHYSTNLTGRPRAETGWCGDAGSLRL